jgi:hypothetical protein
VLKGVITQAVKVVTHHVTARMPGMVVPGQQTNGDACRFITEDGAVTVQGLNNDHASSPSGAIKAPPLLSVKKFQMPPV